MCDAGWAAPFTQGTGACVHEIMWVSENDRAPVRACTHARAWMCVLTCVCMRARARVQVCARACLHACASSAWYTSACSCSHMGACPCMLMFMHACPHMSAHMEECLPKQDSAVAFCVRTGWDEVKMASGFIPEEPTPTGHMHPPVGCRVCQRGQSSGGGTDTGSNGHAQAGVYVGAAHARQRHTKSQVKQADYGMPDFGFDPALNSLAVNTAGVE